MLVIKVILSSVTTKSGETYKADIDDVKENRQILKTKKKPTVKLYINRVAPRFRNYGGNAKDKYKLVITHYVRSNTSN